VFSAGTSPSARLEKAEIGNQFLYLLNYTYHFLRVNDETYFKKFVSKDTASDYYGCGILGFAFWQHSFVLNE